MHLFWRHGYEGASIALLTAQLGLSAPSLYAAFGSKEMLYREALQLYLVTAGQKVIAALNADGPPKDAVRAALRAAADNFTQEDCPLGCMVSTGSLRCSPDHVFAVEATSSLRRSSRDAIRARLVRAQVEEQWQGSFDIGTLALFFASVVSGMAVQALDGVSRAELYAIADQAMQAWHR